MAWYWVAFITGAAMPFLIAPRSILVAFQERGIGIALAAWSGMLWITVPLMLLIMWIAHLTAG